MAHVRKLLAAAVIAAAASPAGAQSAFDGFRVGVEGTASWSRMEVDATRPRDAAIRAGEAALARGEASLDQGRATLARGEASLAQAQERLAASRAELADRRRQLDAGRKQLADGEALAASYRARTGQPTTPYDTAIAEGRARISQSEARLAEGLGELAIRETEVDKGMGEVSGGRADLAAGEGRLASGRATLTRTLGMPAAVTPSGNGQGVRLSAGWGTTFGNLYLGAEADVGTSSEEIKVSVLERSARASIGMVAGAGLRVGWVVHPRVLVYGSGGWEGTRWRYAHQGGKPGEYFLNGGRVGGGVEVHLGDGFLLRAGYDRSLMGTGRLMGADITPSRDTVHVGFVKVF